MWNNLSITRHYMNLIREKLDRTKSADYTKCAEIQAVIQQMVDRDDLIFWATKMEEPVITMALPENIPKRRYKFLAYIP